MTFLHFRYRRQLGLLAASTLDTLPAEWLRTHLKGCASCEAEFAGLALAVEALRRDAALDRPLPISSEALRTRVLARIRTESQPASARDWNPGLALASLGLVGFGLIAGALATRLSSPSTAPPAEVARLQAPTETQANNAAFYERLEKTQLRANAARYLAEAQDILIQVTAAADCPDSPQDSVDVRQEAQTSRTLLRRRAALVSGSGETLTAARGVMEEVEGVLQQVADLPQCTRRTDVDAIARKVDRRNLLMKIDMVTQELAAP
ncbi:MAG: hypothetical protein JJE39_08320 [Vicinamibacteria bacterium]|nr:hypothetical protein [Vicinamibacteria bacterium]